VKDAVGMTIFFENIDAHVRSRETYRIFNMVSEKAHSWIFLVIPAFEAVGAPVNIEYTELPEKV
jgi:ADP-L-glycero-D-manno-heptose 6-epimerase